MILQNSVAAKTPWEHLAHAQLLSFMKRPYILQLAKHAVDATFETPGCCFQGRGRLLGQQSARFLALYEDQG